jgi:hypothetical protein
MAIVSRWFDWGILGRKSVGKVLPICRTINFGVLLSTMLTKRISYSKQWLSTVFLFYYSMIFYFTSIKFTTVIWVGVVNFNLKSSTVTKKTQVYFNYKSLRKVLTLWNSISLLFLVHSSNKENRKSCSKSAGPPFYWLSIKNHRTISKKINFHSSMESWNILSSIQSLLKN